MTIEKILFATANSTLRAAKLEEAKIPTQADKVTAFYLASTVTSPMDADAIRRKATKPPNQAALCAVSGAYCGATTGALTGSGWVLPGITMAFEVLEIDTPEVPTFIDRVRDRMDGDPSMTPERLERLIDVQLRMTSTLSPFYAILKRVLPATARGTLDGFNFYQSREAKKNMIRDKETDLRVTHVNLAPLDEPELQNEADVLDQLFVKRRLAPLCGVEFDPESDRFKSREELEEGNVILRKVATIILNDDAYRARDPHFSRPADFYQNLIEHPDEIDRVQFPPGHSMHQHAPASHHHGGSHGSTPVPMPTSPSSISPVSALFQGAVKRMHWIVAAIFVGGAFYVGCNSFYHNPLAKSGGGLQLEHLNNPQTTSPSGEPPLQGNAPSEPTAQSPQEMLKKYKVFQKGIELDKIFTPNATTPDDMKNYFEKSGILNGKSDK